MSIPISRSYVKQKFGRTSRWRQMPLPAISKRLSFTDLLLCLYLFYRRTGFGSPSPQMQLYKIHRFDLRLVLSYLLSSWHLTQAKG
jgi:hypothetical protein